MKHDCFICRKHAGLEPAPPGGYVYADEHWKVAHGPAHMVSLGTLVIESTRHYLDYAEMSRDEAMSYGILLTKLYNAIKLETGAERVYSALFVEGAPHFHVWLVPRYPGGQVRGPALLEQTSCDEAAAASLALALLKHLSA